MDPLTIPEDLSALTSDEVLALADGIKARLRELRATAPLTRDLVTEMTGLRGDLDRVNTRAVEIDEEAASLEAAAAEATAGLDDEAAPVELAAESTETAAEPVEPVTAEPVELAAAEPEVAPEPEPVAAQVTPLSQRDGLAALRARQSTPAGAAAAPAPVQSLAAARDFGFVAAAPISLPQGKGIEVGQPFNDLDGLSDVICQLAYRNSRQQLSGRSFQYVGHADLFPADTPQRLIDADPVANFALLNAASNPAAAEAQLRSLVASGALCPPDNPIYDFFRLAVPQAPVEAALPTVAAPRGGIRYISAPDFRDARAAIGTRTATENADPETEDKPCSRAVCPTVSEAFVTAVSECVLWDNLQYRAFPELVANYMADVAVNFASVKECLYLTAIDAASTDVVADTPAYGAMRALTYQLRAAASGYRKRNNMPRNAQLVWYAPNWLPDVLIVDMVNDHALGLNMLTTASEALIAQVFANLNITPVWYNDQANCHDDWVSDLQAWRYPQGAGDLNIWPHHPVTYLHSPGTFVRLDSGSLDVGLVRDSVLNGTNDLELFMEQWVGVVMLGIEAIQITHTICPNGTAPDAVAELACAGYAS